MSIFLELKIRKYLQHSLLGSHDDPDLLIQMFFSNLFGLITKKFQAIMTRMCKIKLLGFMKKIVFRHGNKIDSSLKSEPEENLYSTLLTYFGKKKKNRL